MTLSAGTRLGPYKIMSPLGAGGMGEVYRAIDTRLGRDVAIKVVTGRLVGDADALARFQREARVVASLAHPNIVALHDVGTEEGIAFAVMELLDGEPLDRLIGPAGLPWKQALDIAASIADALAYAHERGVVHRDLKPANVFITRDGVVKVLDFGLARQDLYRAATQPTTVMDPGETQPGVVLGTVGYMSPEQVRGEPTDARADIFSLGCVLYELLSGRRPFGNGVAPEVQAAILRDQPGPVADVGTIPPEVNALVQRCLEKRREQRFQSGRDLAFALRQAGAGSGARTAERLVDQRLTRRTVIALGGAGLAIVATGLWWKTSRGPAIAVGGIQSLAVLPLLDLSPDRQQEYFADTITEDLMTRLAKMGNLRVISRTSAMTYRGTAKKSPDIARELGVDALVAGTMQRDGTRLKITAQLIDGRTDRVLWADSFAREVQDVFAMQNDISFAVARQVGLALTPGVNERLTAAARSVPRLAFDEYARGRYAWNKRSQADLREAVEHFNAALDVEPTYAAAWAGLADSYGQLGYGSYDSPKESFPKARKSAEKALEHDRNLAEGHASRGYALMYYDWNFTEAEDEFRRAIELNPNSEYAHQWLAYLLTALERPAAEIEREIAKARELDPLSVAIRTDQAYMFHYYRRDPEAVRAAQEALDMNPRYPLAWFWLGRIYTSQRQYKDADAALQKIGPLKTWTPAMAALGFLYGKTGRSKDALNLLAEFEKLKQSGRYASSYAIAVIHAGLGDRERALKALEDAYGERSHWLVWLKRDPRWDEIRDDRRFQKLVQDVGLPRD
jgi:serine/threonine-protein kinase